MRKVYVVDDDESVCELVSDAIANSIDGVDCVSERDFAAAVANIASIRPDAIVLDLMEGDQNHLSGERAWRLVWERVFCPVVIYSAYSGDLQPPVPEDHPFVKRVTKGFGSERKVVDALRDFRPAVDAISQLRNELDGVIHRVLRDTAGTGAYQIADPTHLVYAGRRRVAASMDAPVESERCLASWELYLLPPIEESPLTGDLLVRVGDDSSVPESYAMILTPSCDLVAGRPKVEGVLVAKCVDMAVMIRKMSLSVQPGKMDASIQRLRKEALSVGVRDGYLALPAFPDQFPNMAVNLRDLAVVPYSEILGGEEGPGQYRRVASIDSPFREQVAWSFLTTVARPGMPDRDYEQWARECLSAIVDRSGPDVE